MQTTPQFEFLRPEWPELFEAASRAEAQAYPDPRSACFYARRSLEIAVAWLYKNDRTLSLPYQDHLAALIHEPTFRQTVGQAIFNKARILKDLGNLAVHSAKPIRDLDAVTAVRELFHLCFWLARTYARGVKPPDSLRFDPGSLPKTSPIPPQTLVQLQTLAAQIAERDARLTALLSDRDALDAELKQLREEVAKAKAENAARPDTHDYSEAETRDFFIDLLLKEAGWALDQPRDREFPVAGMPNNRGRGFVDYVLWGDDGKPLAIIEAKRTKRDPRAGQQQAKLYADCLEQAFGQRPVIFYSNGYDHWLWDDLQYPPRTVQGFYKKAELELMIQRRTSRLPMAGVGIDATIVERYYQTRAIRRIGEAFEEDWARRALVVMATGAGKTRTVIALCDLMMRTNRAKRVLFLADRVALVNQAVGAFKKHLPAASPVNLVTVREAEGRVYVSTYPTMMGLIDETRDGQRKFGVGHFDLVIIDEAHRSVYQKYRAIFEYFDALLVGLTATPRDEVDRDTYRLFELETGVPTDAYGLDEAVKDGYLVPPKAVSVPLRFQREGIRYDQLTEQEKEQWDALEWSEDGDVPDRVEAEAVNRWLFNRDTVDKVLEHLMTRGLKVAGGDRLGKSIIFAKNHAHAEFIAERFNANYPRYRGAFARVVDFKVEYVQSLIDDFSNPAKAPHIAISVDMLDTGIDVPEVVNLVFFKLVRSKTKFWQMLGRGTRLRPELFGPDQPKTFFYLFDYCQNLEFFSQSPETSEGALNESLSKKLFTSRLDLIGALDSRIAAGEGAATPEGRVQEALTSYGVDPEHVLRVEVAARLQSQVAQMDVNNFMVRPQRRLVEEYAREEPWLDLKKEAAGELARNVAGLPSDLVDDDEEAKRFDLLLLRLQLAVLRSSRGFEKLKSQVIEIAGLLEDKASIPMVREQMALIQELQTDSWWQDVTAPLLETVRKRLRLLIKLIEKSSRPPIYSDFEDELGRDIPIALPGFSTGADFERFRAKARLFLREHADHVTIHKLRMNRPLTAGDLGELERILVDAGVGTIADLARAKAESAGLGLFIRSLVGLDRGAAKEAFGGFLTGRAPTANQIEFINLIIDHLTGHGVMDAGLLYESPFTDLNPRGPEGLFSSTDVDGIIRVLEEIRQRAAA